MNLNGAVTFTCSINLFIFQPIHFAPCNSPFLPSTTLMLVNVALLSCWLINLVMFVLSFSLFWGEENGERGHRRVVFTFQA